MTHADQDQSQPDLAGIIDLEGRWIPLEVAASLARAIRIGPGEAPDAGSRALRFTGAQGCLVPDGLAEAGAWGITTQLYELHSERSCGIGDFEDLRTFCLIAARAGADFVGITPLHALFQADPGRCSPFSPSNRRFLNPLHIAVDLLPGYGEVAEIDRGAHRRLAETPLVDYRAVSDTKLPVLRKLWQHWTRNEALAEEHVAFDAFVEEEGRILRDHALFESVSAMMVFVNEATSAKTVTVEQVEAFLHILAPFAPHVAEELWERLGHTESIANAPWPAHDESKLAVDTITLAVQVNGKVRATIEVPAEASKDEVLAIARADEKVQSWLAKGELKREIVVPGRLVNLVIPGA